MAVTPHFFSHPLLRCFGFYRRYPAMFIAATTVAMVVNLSLPVTQHLLGLALDEVKSGVAVVRAPDGSMDLSRAWFWASALMAFAVVRGLIQYLGTMLGMILGQRLLHDLRDRVLIQVQRLDQTYHRKHGVGEIVTRTTRDSDKVRDAVIGGWRTLLETGLVVIACLGILFWYHPALASVPIALVFIALIMFIHQARYLVKLDRAAGDAYDVVTQELTEGIGGVRVIKAFALEDARIMRFRSAVDGFARLTRKGLAFTSVRLPLPQVLVGFSHVWILWCGAGLVADGQLTIGELVASLMIITAIIFRVEGIGRTIQTFAEASASAARIMELLDAEPAFEQGSADAPAIAFGLRLHDVSVRSPAGVTILDHLNLELLPGEVVALVGATGSGKSTLAQLLPRLADPHEGEVSFGNAREGWINARDLRFSQLRQRVQVVYQDSFLFSDTVAANLRLGRPGATDDDIREALRLASAEDIIAGLPEGLATKIGERGATLSGGQRQRLCFARALIARPQVLCCDDATSALDAITERRILDNLRGLGKGDGGKGDSGKGDSGKGDSSKGDSGKGDSGKGDSGKGDSGKGDSGKGDSGKGDSGKGDSGKGNSGKGDSGKGNSGKESTNARSGTTVCLIASKLSTILLADRVVLLERGRIIASGKHQELVASNSAYRELLGLAS